MNRRLAQVLVVLLVAVVLLSEIVEGTDRVNAAKAPSAIPGVIPGLLALLILILSVKRLVVDRIWPPLGARRAISGRYLFAILCFAAPAIVCVAVLLNYLFSTWLPEHGVLLAPLARVAVFMTWLGVIFFVLDLQPPTKKSSWTAE
jgi:hypothetical protein